jgi:HAE1 family hydrophobic/amphiphilic exporter-1
VAESLESLYLQVDGVVGIRRDSERAPNELGLVVDRDRTQHYGINPQVVAGLVGYALRGQSLPKYHAEGREIPVRVRYREEDRSSLDELASFWIPTAAGDVVPLSAVTQVQMVNSRESIWRQNKRIARNITLDLADEGRDETRQRLSAITGSLDLPEGVSFTVPTARGGMDEDAKGMLFALLLSVIFIYLLMGLLFESFILPLSIISTIPLATLGVFWIHFAAGLNIDFLGYVAVVILVGVVVNNGIVLVDYVNRLRHEGHERGRAILLATDRRFRPIMMTALTTVGGMVPLAVNGRMDSGISYTSFALTLIGGMTTATLLTLLVVPVFYTFFDDLRNAFGRAMGAVRSLRRVARLPRGGLRFTNPRG